MRTRLPALLSLTLVLLPAHAADRHVDAARGSNANAGTSQAPWRTLTHAFAQPLAPGDRVLIEGTFDAAQETFPLAPPPGIHLLLRPGGSARIDAGNATALHVHRAGRHDGTILGGAEALVVHGAPAIHFEAVDTARQITLRVVECRLVGDVLVSNGAQSGAYARNDFEPVLETCTVEGDVRIANARLASATAAYVLSARVTGCTITGSLLVSEPETRDVFVASGNRIGAELRFTNHRATGCRFDLRQNRVDGGDLIVDVSAFSSGDVIGNVVAGRLNAQVGFDDRLRVEGNQVTGDLTAGAYYLESVSRNGAAAIRCSGSPPAASFARISDNVCTELEVSLWSPDGLQVDRNRVTGGGIRLAQVPSGGTAVRSNVVSAARPAAGISVASPLGPVFGVTVQDNDLRNSAGVEAGIRLDAEFLSPCTVERNVVQGFASSFVFAGAASSAWPQPLLTLSRNTFRTSASVQVDLDLARVAGEVVLNHNTLAHAAAGAGLALARSARTGRVRFTNNLVAFHQGGDVPAGVLLPADDVRANLTRDGSLDALHPTNLHGDPHFAPGNGPGLDLEPTSPAIGAAIDPLTGNATGDVGARASGLTRTLRSSWPASDTLEIRLSGMDGLPAILLVGVRATPTVALRICDGWIGVDGARFAFATSGTPSGGAWNTRFQVPPVPFTATFQGLRDIALAQGTCAMTNTLIVRR